MCAWCALASGAATAAEEGLIAHWKLDGDCSDHSGANRHAVNHGVRLDGPDGAVFDGVDAWLELPAADMPALGKGPFSIAVWIHTEADLDDVLGDLRDSPLRARRADEHKIISSACKAAVKAHDRLKKMEVDALLTELTTCELPYTCPHGRPTMIKIDHKELEKRVVIQ